MRWRIYLDEARNTHRTVLEVFGRFNVGHPFIAQQIELSPPLKWLKLRREDCNYNLAAFPEPLAPIHFAKIDLDGVRYWIGNYVADTKSIFTFDKDHAMLALPLAAVISAGQYLKDQGHECLDEDQLKFIGKKCCDSHGQLAMITQRLRSLASL